MRSLESVNFDVLFVIVIYLNVADIISLSRCNRHLRRLCLSPQVWIRLGRNLVSQGIALPTEGFKTPDELSPNELVESVVKATRSYKALTSKSAPASKMISVGENLGKLIDVLPITSNIVALIGHSSLTLWDITQKGEIGQYVGSLYDKPFDPTVFCYGLDLTQKTFHFLTRGSFRLGGRIVHRTRVMKVNFTSIRSISPYVIKSVCFEEVASFRAFALPSITDKPVILQCGFLLGNMRLCQVYTRVNILLFVILDWMERKAAFIDTGIPRLAPDGKITSDVLFRVYICSWDDQNERLILTFDGGRGLLYQHIYHASQFLPFMVSFDEFNAENYDNRTIPLLHPSQYHWFSYGAGKVEGCFAPRAVQVSAFQSPWHTFSGVKIPYPCSRSFMVNTVSETRHGKPAALRGNMYIGYPPSTSKTTIRYSAPYSFACDGPDGLSFPFRNQLPCSVRYGAFAWTGNADQIIRIVRFVYQSTEDMDLSSKEVQVCTPLLMNGSPLCVGAMDDDGEIIELFSLDDVHGRLFLIYKSGNIAALHFA